MGETDEFNPLTFEKKLLQLKDTQESIQSLSSWCLKQREHHKKIVQSWLNVLKRVKVDQRLVLFYLANDVIQYSKRKNYEFVESWGLNLQKATPLVRDEKVRHKILRIFKIWEQRSVYDEDFLSDLTGLLSAGAVKKTDDESLDFQPQQLVNKIKQCSVLEADTDLRLKYIHESHLQLSDSDALQASLKDRSSKDDIEKELNEGIGCVERYTQALQREIVAREALLALLSSASQYYSTQRGEVKVVAYAYKNFGSRVRTLKRKLDELIPTLPKLPSPPRRDEEVPSPEPDEDLDLPNNDDNEVSYNIDKTFNTSLSADGSLYNLGLSSFLGNDNQIMLFNDTSAVIDSVSSGGMSQKSDTLPGLDLLTPESTGNPAPPTSFYGTGLDISDEPEIPYRTEVNNQWSSNTTPNSWNIPLAVPAPLPPPPVPAPSMPPLSLPPLSMPPLSVPPLSVPPLSVPPLSVPPLSVPPPPVPPPALMHSAPPASPPPVPPPAYTNIEIPLTDVDHRGVLPPPPPPPVIPTLSVLAQLEDVDHRLLPPPPPPVAPPTRHMNPNKDVDHRNLISLTHQKSQERMMNMSVDQDYRVPPTTQPSDIVESVDMELSEDEESQAYTSQEHSRRNSFNQNNKVLVGGDNGKTQNNTENPLQRTNSMPTPNSYKEEIDMPNTPLLPLSNPFDNMPNVLKNYHDIQDDNTDMYEDNQDLYEDNQDIYEDNQEDWPSQLNAPQTFQNPPRFQRNWQQNFRPNYMPQQQFWPRNGPRQPRNGPRHPPPWNGPRPRFW